MDLFTHDNHVPIIEKFLEKHPKKVLIFDFDQTLSHLDLPWSKNSQQMQAYLQHLDADFYAQKKPRNPTSYVINEFIKKYGDTVWQFDRDTSEVFERDELRAAPCNYPLLDWIQSHKHTYAVYVWSSNVSATIERILEKEGYAHAYEEIVGKDKVRFTKPSPDGFTVIFQDAQQKIPGLQKNDCLMIGNNPLDDKGAAQNAGIDFVRVQYSEVERY